MSNDLNPKTDPGQPTVHQIRIKGHLGFHWTNWFEGLTINLEDNGGYALTGPLIDQATLYGLLKKCVILSMPLLSINRIGPSQAVAVDVK